MLEPSLEIIKHSLHYCLLDGEDYFGVMATFIFPFGQTRSCVPIPIVNDTISENLEEVFDLQIESIIPGNIQTEVGTPSSGTVTILDDDGKDNNCDLPASPVGQVF